MRIKTWSIMFFVSLSIILLSQNYGGRAGLLWGFAIALSINILLYFGNENRLLKRLKCEPIEGQDCWGVVELASQLAIKAHLPIPKIFKFECATPTAFALGRNLEYGCIALSTGLLTKFDKKELHAVLAHEIICIKQYITFGFGVSYIMATTFIKIGQLLDKLLLLFMRKKHQSPLLFSFLFLPIAWLMIWLITSNRHYSQNDAHAGQLIGSPRMLAEVIWKINTYCKTNPLDVPLSSAHIFIVNPLTNNGYSRYFNFHPKIEHRISSLAGCFPV